MTFWTSFFYSLEWRFFVLKYHKRHFSGPYCLKKNLQKMAIFGLKPWVNPSEKMSIFWLFGLLVFIELERRFLVVEYHKRHFPGLYCQKKKFKKWPFLYQNHRLTPLKKCQFFHFLNFNFFFSLERRFIVLEYHKRHFPGLNCLKKKKLKKWPFLYQNHGLTPYEKCQFFHFLNFMFL